MNTSVSSRDNNLGVRYPAIYHGSIPEFHGPVTDVAECGCADCELARWLSRPDDGTHTLDNRWVLHRADGSYLHHVRPESFTRTTTGGNHNTRENQPETNMDTNHDTRTAPSYEAYTEESAEAHDPGAAEELEDASTGEVGGAAAVERTQPLPVTPDRLGATTAGGMGVVLTTAQARDVLGEADRLLGHLETCDTPTDKCPTCTLSDSDTYGEVFWRERVPAAELAGRDQEPETDERAMEAVDRASRAVGRLSRSAGGADHTGPGWSRAVVDAPELAAERYRDARGVVDA